MKRDWELVKSILLRLESKETFHDLGTLEIEGRDKIEVAYHLKLLTEAGLIEGRDLSTKDGPGYWADCLTWSGHDFLDVLRNESVWSKVKDTLKDKALTLPFDVLLELLKSTIKISLGLMT